MYIFMIKPSISFLIVLVFGSVMSYPNKKAEERDSEGRDYNNNYYDGCQDYDKCGLLSSPYNSYCPGYSSPCDYYDVNVAGVQYYPVYNNPTVFIQCGSNYASFCQDCAPGTVFDGQICNHPS